MTERYVAIRLQAVGSDQRPITGMQVKSLITEPREGQFLTKGRQTIRGAAWAGENGVARVEVSTDGGQEWALATLDKDIGMYCWVLWTYPWAPRDSGSYTIAARATDDHGNTQPASRDALRIDGYEMSWYHPSDAR